MAQIQKGTTFTSGGTVTDTNLNNHVDNATLLAGAITDQTSVPSLTSGNQFLVESSGLKRVTAGALFATALPIGSTTPNTVAATTLTASGLATVGSLTSTGLATAGSLSVGGTSAHTGAATFASTATFTGAATFDAAPNFNGGANLGNAAADPVVLNCTLSGTLKGEPVVDLTSVTAAAADKVLIQDASDANKLKVAAFPVQYIKAAVRVTGAGAVVGNSLNVATVVRNSAGNYTITFTSPMANDNYIALAASHATEYGAYTSTMIAGSCVVTTGRHTGSGFSLIFTHTDTPFSLTILEV